MICRLNGRSRAHAQEAAERTLRAMMLRGVEGQAMPAEQGARLLARQLRQVPRWLQQTRYNGPPPLKMPRGSIATASNYSNNAALAGDGQHVAFEAYESKLAVAKARGEIGVVAGSVTGETTLIRRPDRGGRVLPSLGLQPVRVRRRSLRRVRVGRGQPQLRQALRADGRVGARRAAAGRRCRRHGAP